MRHPTRKLVFRCVLAAVVLLAAVGLTELGVRAFCTLPRGAYGHWVGTAHTVRTMVSAPDEFHAVHRYNQFGFRGPDFSIAPTTSRRVICIGDSYTEGLGAAEQQTWPAVLGRRLAYLDCEVLNFGDGGAAPYRYAQIFVKAAIGLKPSHVVVCIISSDIRSGPSLPEDREPNFQYVDLFSEDRSWFMKSLVAVLPGCVYLHDRRRERWSTARDGLLWQPLNTRRRREAVRRLGRSEGITLDQAPSVLDQRLLNIDPTCRSAAMHGRFDSGRVLQTVLRPYDVYDCRLQDMPLGAQEHRAAVRTWLEWFARTCRTHQIEPWLLYFPQAALIRDAPWGPLNESMLVERPQVVGDTSIRDLIGSLCDEFDLPFVDATPVLAAHAAEKLFHRYDTHPTARAYDLVGNIVADRMRSTLPSP